MSDIQIISFSTNTRAFKQALHIRRAVFVEEQKVPLHIEIDVYETECQHYLVLVDRKPCGTGRWRQSAQGIKVERVAILHSHRKQGIGAHLMRMMLEDIHEQHPTVPIYLYAQANATHFYQRLGFVVQGAPFDEANIPHVCMYKSS